jgi:hypothetical protein
VAGNIPQASIAREQSSSSSSVSVTTIEPMLKGIEYNTLRGIEMIAKR